VFGKKEFNGTYTGGVEFKPWEYPSEPPSVDYPCQIISNNSMQNHGSWDNLPNCIVGPARLITANWIDEQWVFSC